MIPLRIRIVPVLVFVLLVRWIMPLAMLLFIPIINRVNIIMILLCWYWKLPSIIRVSVLKVIVNLYKPKLMMLNAGNDVCLTNNRKGALLYIYIFIEMYNNLLNCKQQTESYESSSYEKFSELLMLWTCFQLQIYIRYTSWPPSGVIYFNENWDHVN